MCPSDAGDADRDGRDGRDGDRVDRTDRDDGTAAHGDEELAALLDELEATLSELRSDLQTDRDRRGSSGGPAARLGSGRRPTDPFRSRSETDLPRPPSPGQFLRFTEQYTLPTLVSLLEATIQALELLRGTLRLVDPERSAFDAESGRRNRSSMSRLSGGVAGVGREAVSGVERALSELETAISETDVPEDRTSRELLTDARDLSAELSARLADARQAAEGDRATERDRYGYRRDARTPEADGDQRSEGGTETTGVAIEVDAPDDEDGATATNSTGEEVDDRPEVDVEAELESIRHEVRGDADGVERETDEDGGIGERDAPDEPRSPDEPSDDDPDETERPDRRTD